MSFEAYVKDTLVVLLTRLEAPSFSGKGKYEGFDAVF